MLTRYHIDLRSRLVLVCLLALMIGLVAPTGAQNARTIRLDQGTVIPVRLDDTLSSDQSQPGDPFSATLKTDYNGTYLGLPPGTKIEGTVKDVRPQQDRDPGVLELNFRRVRTPDGRAFAIQGSLIGLDSKSVQRTSDGTLIAKSGHKSDRLTYVGYGAGAGLILGMLTKKPLEDAFLAAGLGFLFGALEKSNNNPKNVVLKPGTEMGVRLDSRVTVTSYYNDSSDYGQDYPRGNARYHRSENSNDIVVMFDQDAVNFRSNAPPVMINGVTMIPATPVLRAAHVSYRYDSRSQILSTYGNNGSVRIGVGSRVAYMGDGNRVWLNAETREMNGMLYVPARFLALATNCDVQFDGSTRTLLLIPKSEPPFDRLP